MELFADLFTGATAFTTYGGIYRTQDGEKLKDKPIIIECFANTSDVNRKNLVELVGFMKRMGKETNQAAVGLVVAGSFYEVTDY